MSNKNTDNINEVEFTEEENKAQIREYYEDDILGGLLASAGFKDNEAEIHPIEIERDGKVVLKFHIRPLADSEYNKAKENNSKYAKNKQLGIKFIESTDNSRYRSELIYIATIEEDRKKIWDNKEAWKKLNVLSGTDLVGIVLKAGEKAAVLELLDSISGYSIVLEGTAKN